MKQRNNEIEVDLGKLLRYYLHHWLALAVSGFGVAFLAIVLTFLLITPKYQASVSFYVNNFQSNQQHQYIDSNSLVTSQKLVQSYINIIQSKTVVDAVIEKGQLQCTDLELLRAMKIRQVDETEMFFVTITHPDGKMAAKAANAIADVAPGRIAKIVKGSSAAVIDRAVVPERPSSPSYPRNFILGGLLGGILMGGLLTFRYLFDMHISEEEELVDRYGCPVLGTIPSFEKEERKKDENQAKGGNKACS